MRISALGLLFPLCATAAAPPAPNPAEIMLGAYLAAWTRADAPGMAATYADDGEFIPPGSGVLRGRAAISGFYQTAFENGYAGRGANASFDEVKIVARDVLLARGIWTIDAAQSGDRPRPKECGDFVLVMRRDPAPDGRWKIELLREFALRCQE